MKPDITFYRRFQADILAGRKTITIRDDSESHFQPGQRLMVGQYEDGRPFCEIEVIGVTPVMLAQLNAQYAAQENMTLDALRSVIGEIYPQIERLYVISFSLVRALAG
ncbi:ASCH domain-containing protein [Edwardsiella ictaluri]|uniref:N(4)-acetylcytidine aminohydrolase n=1 Tax=Edwardsiella ictaluri TaxID=67780 RepID=UPI0009BE9479|nr:N(4)-acetylcytidine aminohydrolase [Edwardsiella ictaluri]ARD38405.1 ASCH domain-containing protein [Edwardsiella ictaluri]QPW26824.1 ASCH domain-containing protein [Edwardsiella ictaluri]